MNNFFGSKLNTLLLFVLIVLMIIALNVMINKKDIYLPYLSSKPAETNNSTTEMDRTKILGNKDDLVSLSIWPGTKVHGVVSFRGVIKGAYFFEGNLPVNVLDLNKKNLKQGHANSTSDWMTAEPVTFEGSIDFSGLPKGAAYFEIHNDNPSDIRANDKSILIPIVIE